MAKDGLEICGYFMCRNGGTQWLCVCGGATGLLRAFFVKTGLAHACFLLLNSFHYKQALSTTKQGQNLFMAKWESYS